MRAVSTMISVAVLATAVFTSSATAASLDVEPIEPIEPTTAPALRDSSNSNSNASNATSDGKIGVQEHTCAAMWPENWDNVKYACSWVHTRWLFDEYYNLFFKRYDGSVVKECDCNKGLWTYGSWGSRWTFSSSDYVACYSRDGRLVKDVQHEFDAYKC